MADRITSLQNPRVRRAALLRDARSRREQGRFLIDGLRETQRALTGGIVLDELFLCPDLCAGDEQRQAWAKIAAKVALVHDVSRQVMEKLAYGDRVQPGLAVGRTREHKLANLHLPSAPLLGVVCGIEKPGNLGAILRSADGAGLNALLIAGGGSDLYNPNTIRASLGTVFTLPIGCGTEQEVLEWLRREGFRILAARVDGATPYTQADFRGRTAIVLGTEAAGLSPAWHGADVTPIALPMRGQADSLNVSAAAAVLFYEALRQRNP